MIVGFTGTRQGPTPRQHDAMRWFLAGMPMERFVHGAAPGCDTFAHNIVRRAHREILIELHPSTSRSSVLAYPEGNCEIWPEMPPLERNKMIVSRVHGLVAVPATDAEGNTGTWATVREGRKLGLPIYLMMQNGRVVRDVSMDMPL